MDNDKITLFKGPLVNRIVDGDAVVPFDDVAEAEKSLTRRGYRRISRIRGLDRTIEVWERQPRCDN